MSDSLGFNVHATRRNLTSLRAALKDVATGTAVAATFHLAEFGRFTVSGRARRDLTDTIFMVAWWDLTTGKGIEPVKELQSLTVGESAGEPDDDAPQEPAVVDDGELRRVVSTLAIGDVVTADFEFESCGSFTMSGEIRRDTTGTKWILAGHHLAYGVVPASRLRRLTIDHKAPTPDSADGEFNLFGD